MVVQNFKVDHEVTLFRNFTAGLSTAVRSFFFPSERQEKRGEKKGRLIAGYKLPYPARAWSQGLTEHRSIVPNVHVTVRNKI